LRILSHVVTVAPFVSLSYKRWLKPRCPLSPLLALSTER
jgi:hypothetical protein